MDKLVHKIFKFNTLYILGIYRYDNHDAYYLLKVKKKAGNLNLISQSSYTSIDAVVKDVDLKLPFVVVIDGKGVLNKKIELNSQTDLVWKKNLDFNTLYFTEFKTETHTLLSFSRKQHVDGLLGTLHNFQIIDFYIGPLLSALLHQSIGGSAILSNQSVLTFSQEGILQEISKADAKPDAQYVFGEESLSAYQLPLYAAALHYYLKPAIVIKSEPEKFSSENILYRRAFNAFGTSILILFFVSLLSSYLLIQYYSSENQVLNQKNIFSNQTYQNIVELQQQREKKIRILNETGQMSKRFLTYYGYQFSGTVPQGVLLERLNVAPLSDEIKENKKVSLLSNEIFVEGNITNEANFDTWLKKLKSIKWIKKFEILSLKKDKKNVQHFEIKIYINNV